MDKGRERCERVLLNPYNQKVTSIILTREDSPLALYSISYRLPQP